MRAFRIARLAEVIYAAIQGGTVYYISQRLSVIGHPLPRSVILLGAGAPVAVALFLAVVLRPRARWVWWPAAAFAVYVIVDGAAALIRIVNLPSSAWPSNAWLGFVAIGLRLLTQAVVVGAAFVVLRRPSIAASPAA